MGVIQIFAREEKTYREFDKLNSDHREAYHFSNLYEASLYSMVEAAGSVSVALLLWYGGGGGFPGVFGIGPLVGFKKELNRFFLPLPAFTPKKPLFQSPRSSAR